MPRLPLLCPVLFAMITSISNGADSTLNLTLREQSPVANGSDERAFRSSSRQEKWKASETAIIVCDVWDYHHCFNAVGRLNEFVPRLNQVLTEARDSGVLIIHSPSDCMEAYSEHPARQRAVKSPKSDWQPSGIGNWCSAIPAEESRVYPIDQSDGGEDDSPEDHQRWAKKLEDLGRNPNLPWQRQTDMLTIDSKRDYISDRGDEVWNILRERGIKNVILTGVHTNMCVLGRPFGLRQMARNGINVVLMRDMTDTMYNPQRWPYVSHFEGTRRVIAHIERYICPTVSSDQLIGGESFRFDGDTTPEGPFLSTVKKPSVSDRHWQLVQLPPTQSVGDSDADHWYRCVVMIPDSWGDRAVMVHAPAQGTSVWCNGQTAQRTAAGFMVPREAIELGDHNLVVVRSQNPIEAAPAIQSGSNSIELAGQWQYRTSSDDALANIPLPAKFGGSADIVYAPVEALWTPRALTRRGQFTPGIEGPACDRDGNIYAVNFGAQGTIGRVSPTGNGEVFVTLPEGSVGNGIRFAKDGSFFVADYPQHNVLHVDPESREVKVFAHNDQMNQPNDLAIAPDGTLYASDPGWATGDGQLWRIDSDGTVTLLSKNMGTTNGIEVSPDGKHLYVNESKQRNVWAFDLDEDGGIHGKRLIRKFEDHGFDGMRCDVDGNLYITRYGKGTVVKMTPQGEILREIPVLGMRPSNICFGGPDGCTAYVTEVEGTRLVAFRVDRPGRSWAEMHR